MKKFELNIAVIGYGHLGKWHAEKADALANLVAIVDVDESNRARAKETYPDAIVTAEIDEILDKVDAALIVTPTSTHFSLLKKLLKHNVHTFCEKPLCAFESEIKELQDLYKQSDVCLQVGHSERFHQSWEIIEKYQSYLDGNCVIRMNRYAPFKGRATDVDVVQDVMIHDLDLLVYLFKELPTSVTATGYKIRTNNWDFASAQFSFNSGKTAFLIASRNHVKEVRDMEVFSDSGCLYVDLMKNEINIASQKEKMAGQYVETMEYSKRDHLMIEQEHFYEAIITNQNAIVTFNDGVVAVKLISRVLESIESGKTVPIKL